MNELHARDFKRVYTALLLDLILTVTLPLLLFGLAVCLDAQLRTAGLAEEPLSTRVFTQASGPLLNLFLAWFPARYCASALCALLALSGLDEMASASPWLLRSRRCFLGCALMNAAAMAVRLANSFFLHANAPDALPILSQVVQAITLALLGAAEYTLMRGYGEVLERIGAQRQAGRANRLSRWLAAGFVSYSAAYFAFVTDFSQAALPLILDIVLLIVFLLSFLLCLWARVQAMRCAGQTWKTFAEISDEVIT